MKPWEAELQNRAEKYHTVGAWVAIVLNPDWASADYYTIPEYWQQFLVIRLAVALLTLITLLLKKRIDLKPEWLIFVPFLGIALQNGYMYSVMDVEMIQKHTFAYIALCIGAGMLVLWKPAYSIAVVVLNILGNVVFFYFDSTLEIGEVLINGGLLTLTVSIFTILLIHTRYNLTKKEIQSRLALEDSKKEIEIQNKHITDSIRYAKKIQEAILPSHATLDEHLDNYFVLYKPKDIVCGDFYWFTHQDGRDFIAAVDCTGHGVPGAFMSMIGNTLLNEIVIEKRIHQPGKILDNLKEGVIKALRQSGETNRKEGMDIAICAIDRANMKLEYAGAFNPLCLVTGDPRKIEALQNKKTLSKSGKTLLSVEADKQPIGFYYDKKAESFTNHTLQLVPGDSIYIFSDGFADQFGGEKGMKYMYKRMKRFFLDICHKPVAEQKDLMEREFENWRGDHAQLDDVCIIGIKF